MINSRCENNILSENHQKNMHLFDFFKSNKEKISFIRNQV